MSDARFTLRIRSYCCWLRNCVRSTTGRVVLWPEIENFSKNLRNRGNLCNPNYYMSIRNCWAISRRSINLISSAWFTRAQNTERWMLTLQNCVRSTVVHLNKFFVINNTLQVRMVCRDLTIFRWSGQIFNAPPTKFGEQGGLAHDIILETDSTSSFKPFSEKKVTQQPRKKIKNYAWKVHCWSL